MPAGLMRKIRRHVRLLRADPEAFARNLTQFTHRDLFRARLMDVLTAAPLHVRIDAALANRPAVNVLQPVLSAVSMTGGPNTIVNLAFWLAMRGVPVRIVTTQDAPGTDPAWFWRHLAAVTGSTERPQSLAVCAATDAARPLAIGPRDMFLATHWTTAQQVKALLPRMDVARFFYLIQDYEPGFYAWSSNHALALETYGLDHIGIFNEATLRDFLVTQGVGRYADPGFARSSLVFEPALDRALFHPPALPRTGLRRRLLFYARPTNPRNMLGLGFGALCRAIEERVFGAGEWEFLAIGSRGSVPPLELPGGHVLRPAPWADYAEYARLLRESDILLCPMLSPHTSYPVLEMAASGGVAVTNSFATKTAESLGRISPNIVAAPPTEDGFVTALHEAARRVVRGYDAHAPLRLPQRWDEALGGVAERMAAIFAQTTAMPDAARAQEVVALPC